MRLGLWHRDLNWSRFIGIMVWTVWTLRWRVLGSKIPLRVQPDVKASIIASIMAADSLHSYTTGYLK